MFQNSINYKKTQFVFIILLVAFPKISFIEIPGYWQGLRIDDFICLIFLILIMLKFIKKDQTVLPDKNFIGLGFYFCLPFLIFSYLVSVFNNFELSIVSYLRIIEYFIIIISFNLFRINFQIFVKFLKILLIVNFIFCILQFYDLIGHISSRGPQIPDYRYFKATGIFSSTLENSFISLVIYFIISLNIKRNMNIYLLIVIVTVLLADNRTLILAMILSIFLMNFNMSQILKKNYILIFPILIIVFFLFYFFSYKLFQFDLFYIFQTLKDLVIYNIVDSQKSIDSQYYSWNYRLIDWQIHLNNYSKNIYTYIFGTGINSIYYESGFIRLLTSFGIFSVFIILYLIRNFPAYFSVIILVSSVTADIVVSFKIFIIVLIYCHVLEFVKNEYRNRRY